jgi:Ca2+-binding EF-hand superfamily protein
LTNKTVFKFLDTDGDGTLSPKEFRTGITLLNKRLPAERQLQNPDELFQSLDEDGNGEISFEEFTHGFGFK